MTHQETIAALATPSGAGAISVIRISGPKAFEIAFGLFRPLRKKDMMRQKTHTIHLGHIVSGEAMLDEVLLYLFKGPNSYTGEDTIEISCHGSPYIQHQILQLLIRSGCRMAQPGEFTLRAFLNGKIDLSQAEAVADLIASDNEASHRVAMQQMRGGFSNELELLRTELLNFASLIELELDFSEEDVEFADRSAFSTLLERIKTVLKRLIDSFAVGNVIKNGIPVAIAGEPNVGKSTLLNALLNEERAIVSDIAGTTRDVIEDEISIGGLSFRFIDTAGIRDTQDVIESIGIRKTFEKMESAQVILYLVDIAPLTAASEMDSLKNQVEQIRNRFPQKPLVIIGNKADKLTADELAQIQSNISLIPISAKTKDGLEELKTRLLSFVNTGALKNSDTIVTNSRHYDALLNALNEIVKVRHSLEAGVPADLMAIDIRQALYHLGEITGQVTNDELLGNIFANFCIGK